MNNTVTLFQTILYKVKSSKNDVKINLLDKLKQAGKLDANVNLPNLNQNLIIQFGIPSNRNSVSIIQIRNLDNRKFEVTAGN